MQLINGGIQNIVLFFSGLVLLGAGGVLIRFRDVVAQYLRDLRTDIFGGPAGRPATTRPPWLPVVAGIILIVLGVIGAAGGLFATLPPLGTPRT